MPRFTIFSEFEFKFSSVHRLYTSYNISHQNNSFFLASVFRFVWKRWLNKPKIMLGSVLHSMHYMTNMCDFSCSWPDVHYRKKSQRLMLTSYNHDSSSELLFLPLLALRKRSQQTCGQFYLGLINNPWILHRLNFLKRRATVYKGICPLLYLYCSHWPRKPTSSALTLN